jgi:TolA-binding protein
MNIAVRIGLYCVLLCAAAFFGQRFLRGYAQRADRAAQLPTLDTATNAAPATPAEPAPDPAGTDNAATNAPASGTKSGSEATDGTNAPAASAPTAASRPQLDRGAPIGLHGALGLAAILALAALAAFDLSHYFGSRTHHALYNEEGEGFADPEYDVAEQAWANGEHLEAIRLMRDYYATHPKEIHVAFRIAEIYERDLGNTLAAALEHEEILRCTLSAERWGWTAIHLCNLYTRLNQTDKAQALLRRIVAEYGQTAAARKAREKLGQDEADLPAEDDEGQGGGRRLPPGFKLRKR